MSDDLIDAPLMTSDELRKAGEELYGPQWQSKMAEALPVSTRAIRYWLSEKRAIREVIARRIRSLKCSD